MTAPWVWNDETEICVSRIVANRPHLATGSRTAAISWSVRKAMANLGEKADLDMVASAVAAHLCGESDKWRIR
jgi:hypothetical protein